MLSTVTNTSLQSKNHQKTAHAFGVFLVVVFLKASLKRGSTVNVFHRECPEGGLGWGGGERRGAGADRVHQRLPVCGGNV